MTVTNPAAERRAVLDRIVAETRTWSGHVDRLIDAFRSGAGAPAVLAPKMEALRHKRDRLVTKVRALEHHRQRGWSAAERDFREARRELREAWRSVIATLDRECEFP